MGCLVSFTGNITYKNAGDLQHVVKSLPIDKIMIETGAPFLTPVPHRGTRNEPMYVKYVAEKIAELRGVSFEKVAEITTNTAKKFFNIN